MSSGIPVQNPIRHKWLKKILIWSAGAVLQPALHCHLQVSKQSGDQMFADLSENKRGAVKI
jgi:hypothetical protein